MEFFKASYNVVKRAINVMISSTSREDFGHQEPRTPGPFRTGSVPLEVTVVLSPKQVMCRTYMRNPGTWKWGNFNADLRCPTRQ